MSKNEYVQSLNTFRVCAIASVASSPSNLGISVHEAKSLSNEKGASTAQTGRTKKSNRAVSSSPAKLRVSNAVKN